MALANNLPFRDGPARTAAARGDLRAAIEIYRRLNQPGITAKWTSVHEPRLVLAVARLADRAGDRETARAEYTRFLELWKGADDGLPELAESQKYSEESRLVEDSQTHQLTDSPTHQLTNSHRARFHLDATSMKIGFE